MRWTALAALLAASTLLAQPPEPALWSLAGGVEAAAKDIISQPNPQSIRYLDLYAAQSRQQLLDALRGHLNQLSTEPDIQRLNVLPGTMLLRLNLEDYGWSRDVWEKLADADPWHHARLALQEDVYDVRIETVHDLWPGGPDKFGDVYPKGTPYTWERKIRVKRVATSAQQVIGSAPWLPAEPMAALIKHTGSRVPIVRGDWFLRQTAAQDARTPGYYDFMGFKKRDDFERLIGYSADLQKSAKEVELLETVSMSGVAQQPRRLGRFPTIRSMGYWRSFDNKLATDKRNPLRVLNGEFLHDAEESFGPLPNKFWAWWLGDQNGVRQDSAPEFIGPDRTSQSNDGKIHIGIGCNRCHYNPAFGGQAGIMTIDGYTRKLYSTAGPFRLQSPDYAKLRELRAKYLRDLNGPIEDDRRTHARAVKEATGLTPELWGAAMAGAYAAYEERGVDLRRAAREAGMTADQLKSKLTGYLRRTGSLDTVLSGLLNGSEIGIRQFEEAWPLLMEVVK